MFVYCVLGDDSISLVVCLGLLAGFVVVFDVLYLVAFRVVRLLIALLMLLRAYCC